MASTILDIHVSLSTLSELITPHTSPNVRSFIQDHWYPEVNRRSRNELQQLTSFASTVFDSTGAAGLIQSISMLSQGHIVAGVFGILATAGWTIQGVGNAWYYRQVRFDRSFFSFAIE